VNNSLDASPKSQDVFDQDELEAVDSRILLRTHSKRLLISRNAAPHSTWLRAILSEIQTIFLYPSSPWVTYLGRSRGFPRPRLAAFEYGIIIDKGNPHGKQLDVS